MDAKNIHAQYIQLNNNLHTGGSTGSSDDFESIKRSNDISINNASPETQIISGTKSLKVTSDKGPLGITYNLLSDDLSGNESLTASTGEKGSSGICWKVGTYSYDKEDLRWKLTNTKVYCGNFSDYSPNREIPMGEKVVYAIRGIQCTGDRTCDQWAESVELPTGEDFETPAPEDGSGGVMGSCTEGTCDEEYDTCEGQGQIFQLYNRKENCEIARAYTLGDLNSFCSDADHNENCGVISTNCQHDGLDWYYIYEPCCCEKGWIFVQNFQIGAGGDCGCDLNDDGSTLSLGISGTYRLTYLSGGTHLGAGKWNKRVYHAATYCKGIQYIGIIDTDKGEMPFVSNDGYDSLVEAEAAYVGKTWTFSGTSLKYVLYDHNCGDNIGSITFKVERKDT